MRKIPLAEIFWFLDVQTQTMTKEVRDLIEFQEAAASKTFWSSAKIQGGKTSPGIVRIPDNKGGIFIVKSSLKKCFLCQTQLLLLKAKDFSTLICRPLKKRYKTE